MSVTSILANALKIPSLQMSAGAKSVAKSADRMASLAANLKSIAQLIGGKDGPMAGPAKRLEARACELAKAPSRNTAFDALKEVHNLRKTVAVLQRQVSERGVPGSSNDLNFRKCEGIARAAEDIMASPHRRMSADRSPAMEKKSVADVGVSGPNMWSKGAPFVRSALVKPSAQEPRPSVLVTHRAEQPASSIVSRGQVQEQLVQRPTQGTETQSSADKPSQRSPVGESMKKSRAVDLDLPQRSVASGTQSGNKKSVTFAPSITVHEFPKDS